MLDIKRNIDEIIAIYTLEKDIVDIYVEGITDKLIIENYFEYVKCDKSVKEVNDIDFLSVKEQFMDLDLKSNKNKLIALSILLTQNNISLNVKCLIDRDFDGILTEIQNDPHILYTDYSCMESYLCSINHIGKILKLGIRNFPHNTELVIKEVSKVAYIFFIVRLINEYFQFKCSYPKVENSLQVDKKTGICNISIDNYLDNFIAINKLFKHKPEILDFLKEITNKLPAEMRFNMNGHDFVCILFHYINKIKNTVNYKYENFERTFYLSIQPNHLDEYELFKKITT